VANVTTRTHWTVDDLDELPDDEWSRYEIINGKLFVSKSPRREHQLATNRIGVALTNWIEDTGLGEVIPGTGVIFSATNAVIPDLIWVSKARHPAIVGEDGHYYGAPELIVEVLSPGAANERRDRDAKLQLYSHFGVDEYWLLDWRTRSLDVYRQQYGALQLVATLQADDTLESPLPPGFSVRVGWIFERL
jgi:Uma2 family endonuclease